MAQLLKSREPNNLSPLLLDAADELEPAVASLNRLLVQVRELLEREKRFLSYAAHELRTPLAVLRLQADNALNAPDPADRAQSLRQLDRSVVRATRLVSSCSPWRGWNRARSTWRWCGSTCSRWCATRSRTRTVAFDRGQELVLEADEGETSTCGRTNRACRACSRTCSAMP